MGEYTSGNGFGEVFTEINLAVFLNVLHILYFYYIIYVISRSEIFKKILFLFILFLMILVTDIQNVIRPCQDSEITTL